MSVSFPKNVRIFFLKERVLSLERKIFIFHFTKNLQEVNKKVEKKLLKKLRKKKDSIILRGVF
ncbi:MAG: hypothetical protein DLD55_05355 [candidate division SR1 bacterium]|nr:MAG: hypothetical protein DLD55_05355 [candidate division SR1 bacterium]